MRRILRHTVLALLGCLLVSLGGSVVYASGSSYTPIGFRSTSVMRTRPNYPRDQFQAIESPTDILLQSAQRARKQRFTENSKQRNRSVGGAFFDQATELLPSFSHPSEQGVRDVVCSVCQTDCYSFSYGNVPKVRVKDLLTTQMDSRLGKGLDVSGYENNVVMEMAYSSSSSTLPTTPVTLPGMTGPQKSGEYIWGNTLYDEDGNPIGTVNPITGEVWKDGVIIGHYSNGSFTTQGEPVDNPVGSPLCLLVFALIYYMRRSRLIRRVLPILIVLVGLPGIANAGISIQANTYLYMDNSAANWSYTYTYIAAGHNNANAELLQLKQIYNTKLFGLNYLYPVNYSGDYICLYAAGSPKTGDTYAGMQNSGSNITLSWADYTFYTNNCYYIKPSAKGSKYNPSSIEVGRFGSDYHSLNQAQTVKVYISTDGGESYRETNEWPCEIHADAYAFTSADQVTRTSGHALSSSSNSYSSAYTSLFTLTESNTGSDYTFVGWFSSGGDTLSTDASYIYAIDKATTICAYFNQKPKIALNVVGKGTTSFNPSSRITVSPIISGVPRGSSYLVCYDFPVQPAGANPRVSQKDDGSQDVIVTCDKLGDYQIRAMLKEGADCTSGDVAALAEEEFSIEQYVTLKISGGHTLGSTVTLTTVNSVADGTYTFTVIDPDGGAPQSIQSGAASSCNYTLEKEGEYSFYVQYDKNSENIHATDHNTWSATKKMYLRYKFLNATNDGRLWTNVPMTYQEESGLYYYYSATEPKSSYDEGESPGGNVFTDGESESTNYLIIQKNGFSSDIEARIFFYNPANNTLYLSGKDSTKYRIKSECGKKTYYSNEISGFEGGTDVSFFATFDGTLRWEQTSDNGLSWNEGNVISVALTKDGVYTAKATAMSASGVTDVQPYTDDYKIFGAVTQDTTNIMAHFENISSDEFYDHYWVKWIGETSVNTYATVGNTINHSIADRRVDYWVNNANIRYAYNPSTNYFSRTFLKGSDQADFLKVYGNKIQGATTEGTAITFNDGSDWVYQKQVIVSEAPADIAIVSTFGGKSTYLLSEKGLESDHLEILGSKTEGLTNAPFEIVYDYKTNRVIAAWSPDLETSIGTAIKVDADLLITRDALNNSDFRTLQFTNNGEAAVLRRIILAMEMNRDSLFADAHTLKHGDASRLFQITLPYEADLTSTFGLSDYGQKWVIQDYKGELRAKIGWQYDGSDFWAALLWSKGTKLRKGRGYVIATNYTYDEFKEIGPVGNKISKKTLYLPSPYNAEGYVIDGKAPAASMYSELRCTKKGREPFDSNWRCVGAPSFYPVDIQAEGLEYYYTWNGRNDSYTLIDIASEPTLQPTRNYIIQYSGLANWNLHSSGSSAPLRRSPGKDVSISRYRFDLLQDSTETDRAYLKLSEAGTDEYVIGGDMLKMFAQDEPQIFTVTRNAELAANHVSDTTTRVVLGVSLPEAGDYRLHLREGGQRKAVVLYDTQEEVYADLEAGDYCFHGEAGKDSERFVLMFGQQVPQSGTALDNVAGAGHRSLRATIAGGQLIVQSDQPFEGDVRLFDVSGRLISEQHVEAGTYSVALPLPSVAGIYLIQAGEASVRIIKN